MIFARLRWPPVGVALLAAIVASCVRTESNAADSPRAAAQEDSAPVADAPAVTPTQPEEHIGRMRVLDQAGSVGECSVEARSDPRVTYVTAFQRRVIKVDVGDSTRAFRPTMLDVSVSRLAGADEETESAFATFDSTGRVKVGTRQYHTSGSAPLREQKPFSAEDSTAARQLALEVADLCRKELLALPR